MNVKDLLMKHERGVFLVQGIMYIFQKLKLGDSLDTLPKVSKLDMLIIKLVSGSSKCSA